MPYFRRKTGVLRNRRSYTRYSKKKYISGIKQVTDKMKTYAKAPTLQKVIQIVNKAVNSNVENKMSNNTTQDIPICIFSSPTPQWWVHSFANFFDLGVGTAQNQRIGNRFKLKTWKIKCLVSPTTDGDPTIPVSSFLPNSFQRTLRVFLGKQIGGGNNITSALANFYQNGNTSISPTGAKLEQLYTINNDVYKVYTQRTYKMGMSVVPDTAQTIIAGGNTNQLINTNPNNDFSLTKTFTIDVLKYIGKNATIRFNDGSTTAQVPSTMEGLYLWALWSPVTGSLANQGADKNTSWYRMTMNTFFEYEDA